MNDFDQVLTELVGECNEMIANKEREIETAIKETLKRSLEDEASAKAGVAIRNDVDRTRFGKDRLIELAMQKRTLQSRRDALIAMQGQRAEMTSRFVSMENHLRGMIEQVR